VGEITYYLVTHPIHLINIWTQKWWLVRSCDPRKG